MTKFLLLPLAAIMGEHSNFILSEVILPPNTGEMVSIFVPYEHPLLKLKQALDWGQLEAVMQGQWREAGKNIDGGRGLSFPVSFYVRLVVLMAVKSLNSREMEQYIGESVVARVFLEINQPLKFQIKDHASIARAQAGLGEAGFKEVNQLIVKEAVRLGFAKKEILSSDTTVQEPLIGYPHEAGILRGVAQRVARIAKKFKQVGIASADSLREKVKVVLKEVKNYYLFSSGAEAKEKALEEVLKVSEELLKTSAEFIKNGVERSQQGVKNGIKKLGEIVEFTNELMPQIKSWMETGVVATEKLLHCGITPGPGNSEKQSREENRIWFEMVDQSNQRRLCFWGSSRSESGREKDAVGSVKAISGSIWRTSHARDERLRSRRKCQNNGQTTEKRGSRESGNPAQRANLVGVLKKR